MLAIVRVPTVWMHYFKANPALQKISKFCVGQEAYSMYRQHCFGAGWSFHRHVVKMYDIGGTRDELVSLFGSRGVKYALVCQKLLWYSTAVEQACRELRIPLVWCENFFDDRVVMDRVGLQYCAKNEIHFESFTKPGQLQALSGRTRQPQPNELTPTELMAKLQLPVPDEPIVVLGQVPHDMALVETPGLKYNDWLDAMFRNNLNTFFLFKHHPLAKTTLPLENYSNVMVINENIASLWAAFDHFAAYSSTTIFEGMDRGKKFATGGYHFCSGLTLQINTADGMKNLMEQLRAYEIPEEAWMRRQTFLCNHYSVSMSSPRLWARMTLPSEKFFAG